MRRFRPRVRALELPACNGRNRCVVEYQACFYAFGFRGAGGLLLLSARLSNETHRDSTSPDHAATLNTGRDAIKREWTLEAPE